MKRKILYLIMGVLLFSLVGITGVNAESNERNTHLRMSPGKVELDQKAKPGEKIFLYRYYVRNASNEAKNVRIYATGNLEFKEVTTVIKPNERYYFEVYLNVPEDEKREKISDYVIAKSSHENAVVTLQGKVDYTVDVKEETPMNKFLHGDLSGIKELIWPFILIFIGLFTLFVIIYKKKKRKNKEDVDIEKEDKIRESTYENEEKNETINDEEKK